MGSMFEPDKGRVREVMLETCARRIPMYKGHGSTRGFLAPAPPGGWATARWDGTEGDRRGTRGGSAGTGGGWPEREGAVWGGVYAWALQTLTQPCTALRSPVQPCTALHSPVQPCAALRNPVQPCADLHSPVQPRLESLPRGGPCSVVRARWDVDAGGPVEGAETEGHTQGLTVLKKMVDEKGRGPDRPHIPE